MEKCDVQWYEQSWFVGLMLVIFFPAGIYLMYKYANWKMIIKNIITMFIIAIVILIISPIGRGCAKNIIKNDDVNLLEISKQEEIEDPNIYAEYEIEHEESEIEIFRGPKGKQISLEYAIYYVTEKEIGFSYESLVDQLVYDGFKEEDARYAADNCGANWNKESVKNVKVQLEIDIPKDEIDEILKETKFTKEQIEYALKKCNIN